MTSSESSQSMKERRSSGSSQSMKERHPSQHLGFITVAPGIIRSSNETELQMDQSLDIPHEEISGTMDPFPRLSAAVPEFRYLTVSAEAATRAEQKLTFLGGCRLYPKAIAWSAVLSSAIIMEGYGTTLIFSFFTLPLFRRLYGQPVNGSYQISAPWQAGLANGAVVGEIIGLFINGVLADRVGYRRTMIGSVIFLSLSIFLAFFAVNIQMLLAAQILCGIPWGVFQTLTTTYAAEVMPVAMRAYLLSNVNMCWLLGQICGVGVVRALVNSQSKWSYRLPFALQWVFAVPILVGVILAPESPWWLVRQERPDKARGALSRLTKKGKDYFNLDETVAMMKHTNEVEKFLGSGRMSFKDCFKGTDLRRTEIACMVWVTQQACFSGSGAYAAYFYEQAGFSVDNSWNLAIGMSGLAVTGGIMAWFLMPRFGRRTLYIYGLLVSAITLAIAGGIGSRPETRAQSWAVGSLLIFLTFIYDLTVGPVCYILVAEIPSTRLRTKTVVLARVAYNVVGIFTNTITSRMLNPTAWNLKGKSCFFNLGITILCLTWCYFRLPETFGLSYLEIDILFEKKANVSKFRELRAALDSMGYFSLSNDERQSNEWRGY